MWWPDRTGVRGHKKPHTVSRERGNTRTRHDSSGGVGGGGAFECVLCFKARVLCVIDLPGMMSSGDGDGAKPWSVLLTCTLDGNEACKLCACGVCVRSLAVQCTHLHDIPEASQRAPRSPSPPGIPRERAQLCRSVFARCAPGTETVPKPRLRCFRTMRSISRRPRSLAAHGESRPTLTNEKITSSWKTGFNTCDALKPTNFMSFFNICNAFR